jgi:hypothetical protein
VIKAAGCDRRGGGYWAAAHLRLLLLAFYLPPRFIDRGLSLHVLLLSTVLGV